MNFDLLIIGSGPGGYVAAIRATQLGLKTAVIERSELGGICLNWGCIPTKALLKSAQVFEHAKHAADYGISVSDVKIDFEKIISRSRGVSASMSKGIQFLFQKNKIEVLKGTGKLISQNSVEVTDEFGNISVFTAKNILLATGARSRELPHLKQDGKKIIGYRQALSLEKQPNSMLVVGSGAIGTELAFFYQTIGTQVTLVEMLPNIVPLEDEEVSKYLERCLKKMGMKTLTNSVVEEVDTSGEKCVVKIKTQKGIEIVETDVVFSAVGISPNIENLGLETLEIEIERGKVKVDEYYRTSVSGVFAIGDIIATPALAHVASAEGIICVEKIAGLNPHPLNYKNIPGCTYTSPEIASVGLTEKAAKESGFNVKIGKFPFTASGKAMAASARDGFVKLIFDEATNKLLGAHLIGYNVTEMIAELVVARNLDVSAHELIKSIHPHPTISEAIMEAAAAAYGEVIHL